MTARFRIAAFLLILVPAHGCARDAAPGRAPEVAQPSGRSDVASGGPDPVDVPAPMTVFTMLDGSEATLERFRGKTVLVNFWATWCGPCVREMPWLAQVRERIGSDGFEVLGIATAEPDTAVVARFAREHPVPFPIAFDPDGVVADAFGGVYAMPTSFLVDGSSIIRYRYLGVIPEDAPIDSLVASLRSATN